MILKTLTAWILFVLLHIIYSNNLCTDINKLHFTSWDTETLKGMHLQLRTDWEVWSGHEQEVRALDPVRQLQKNGPTGHCGSPVCEDQPAWAEWRAEELNLILSSLHSGN